MNYIAQRAQITHRVKLRQMTSALWKVATCHISDSFEKSLKINWKDEISCHYMNERNWNTAAIYEDISKDLVQHHIF